MSAASSKCLVRGSINIDEFFHLPHIVRPGETISSTTLSRGAGGKGANQAFSIARAGGNVVLEGNIGADGIWVRDLLKREGLDVGRVGVLDDEVTGRAIIQSSADGENSIILHKGANYHYTNESTQPDLNEITHLILQNEIDPRITSAFLSASGSSSSGVVSIYNPSPMPSPSELRNFPWSALSWLIVNEGELSDLLSAFGVQHSTNDQESTGGEAGDLLDRVKVGLDKLHAQESFKGVSVICTLGAKGIVYSVPPSASASSRDGQSQGHGQVGHLPAAKVINGVKDTTGAGDCFAGYFAAGLMRGESSDQVLRTCLTACAMCVEQPGAMESVPLRKDVEARMRS